jgi:hypothetical protein
MYTEDYEDAVDSFHMSDVSIDESSSMDSTIVERRKNAEINRRLDKDYYSFKLIENTEDGQVLERIRVYSSHPGGMIRNAPTGIRENHVVGSKYDALYFIVKDVAIGTRTDVSQEPRKLFYRNPEEFERHQRMTLPQSLKAAWYEKNLNAKRQLL